jgi:outer membrane lipoprotein-sorting protein
MTNSGRRADIFPQGGATTADLSVPFRGSSLAVDPHPFSLYHFPMSSKLLYVAALFLAAVPLSAQSVDEIISNYVAARGGLDKIKSVKTERVTGSISFGPDAEGPFLVERQRPLKMHMEISLSGQTLIRVYDGKSAGWIYNPFMPNPSVQPMSAYDLANIFDEADFDGPFIDYKDKGNKIEFVEKTEIVGKPAYKVKLTSKNGEGSFFYFDASTWLLLKWEGNRKVEGKDVPWESFFRDFRDINGLKYPFLVESDAPGTQQTQKITAEKIEVNIPLENSLFEKPTLPAGATAPAVPPADTPKPQ